MSRITVNELNNRVNELDAKLDKLIDMMSRQEKAPTVKNSGAVKGSHKSKKPDTKAATTLTVNVVDGTGRGSGKKFIAVTFDGKPADKVRETLKAAGFKYFAPTRCWSAPATAKNMAVADGLMK